MEQTRGELFCMWSKRKEDELPPQRPSEKPSNVPTASAPAPAVEPQRRETATMSSPSRNLESDTPTSRPGAPGSAALGKNVTVKGQIFAREDLTIDGEVEGTVECHEHRLTIGPNARVQAGLKAREIIIQGSIQGNVDATDKIDIKKEAKLVGDIKTSRIVIEDGAYFKGSIDISKGTARPVNAPAASSAPAAAATSSSPNPAPTPAAAGNTGR